MKKFVACLLLIAMMVCFASCATEPTVEYITVEKIVEKVVEKIVEVPVEVEKEIIVEVEKEIIVEVPIEVEKEVIIEVEKEVIIEIPVEVEVEKEVIVEVDKYNLTLLTLDMLNKAEEGVVYNKVVLKYSNGWLYYYTGKGQVNGWDNIKINTKFSFNDYNMSQYSNAVIVADVSFKYSQDGTNKLTLTLSNIQMIEDFLLHTLEG